MSQSTLTLSVEASVVSRAKRYAKRRGVSISKIVETYLALLSDPSETPDAPPILRSLRGTIDRANVGNYKRHLAKRRQ